MEAMSLGMRIRRLRGEARQKEVDLVLERWRAWDSSQAAFCKEVGISSQSLRRWLRAQAAPRSQAGAGTFIEVRAPRRSGVVYEVALCGGARVLVPSGFEDSEVARLLAVASAC